MSNEYYDPPPELAPGTKARSVDINQLSQRVDAGFDKLPDEVALKGGFVNYAVNTGTTGSAYKVQLAAAITAYTDGLEVKLRPTRDNTGACTLNVNGLGNIAIKRADGTDPQAGDILGAAPITLVYQATGNVFRLPSVVNSQIIQAAGASASAQASATAAAASAATALKTLAIESDDPPADPTEGQEWIDAATSRRFTFIEGQWAETYASQVTDQPTLVDALSDALQLADYAGLRAYAGPRRSVYVTGYLVASAPAGIAGMFVRDDSDTTSADNGGTVIVAANGKRWKRQVIGNKVMAAWFGVKGDGSSCVLATRAAIASLGQAGGTVWMPDGINLLDKATLIADPSPTVSGFNYWFLAASNVTIEGGPLSILKVDNNVITSDAAKQYAKGYQIFWAWNLATISNFAVRGLTIDCNGVNNLVPAKNGYGSAAQTHVMVTNCGINWTFEDVTVLSTSGYQCVAFYLGAKQLKVMKCRFYDMATSIAGNVNLLDHSTIYCEGSEYLFTHNRFVNANFDTVATAIEAHGADGVIAHNYIKRYHLMMLRAAMLSDSYNVTNEANVGDDVTIGMQFDAGPGFKLEAMMIGNQVRIRDAAQRGTRTPGAINTAASFVNRNGNNRADIRIKDNRFYAPASITAAGYKAILGGNVDYLLLEQNSFVGFAKYYEAGNFVDGSSVVVNGDYVEGATGALFTHATYVAGAANMNVDYRICDMHLSKSPGLTAFLSCTYDNAHIRNVVITGKYSIAIQPYTGYWNLVGSSFRVDYVNGGVTTKTCAPFITGQIYDLTNKALFVREQPVNPAAETNRWRVERMSNGAPTAPFAVEGDHQGDVVRNMAPTAGGFERWLCVVTSANAATLGTWKGAGAIAA